MSSQPIGVLDSGVGGLSIWKEIVKQLPNESTVYIADSKNCPYGVKSSKEIYRLARDLVQFLIGKDVKLIVLACNTITVSCLDKLRQEFPQIPIVGTVPVIKTAAELSKNKKIGILSTSQTAKSIYQKELINRFAKECEVINLDADELVPIIEEGEVDNKMIQIILTKRLQPLAEANVDTLALGCSHFPFIKEQIQQVLGSSVAILDSGAAIARQVRRVLGHRQQLSGVKKPTHQFFTTGDRASLQRALDSLIGYNAGSIQVFIRSHLVTRCDLGTT